MSKAKNIVKKIVADLTDRSGLQNEWEGIDEDTRNEIEKTWEEIIEKELKK